MKQHGFEKFISSVKGARKKEAIKQEKRRMKRELKSKIQEEGSKNRNSEDKTQTTGNKKQFPGFTPDSNKRKSGYPRGNSSPGQTGNRRPETGNHKTLHQLMPLNKFIAHTGICSRREAAELVKKGRIKVNNVIILEPGFKVSHGDKVSLNHKQLQLQKNLVYILLNKPKDYITTTKDPQGRKTIFELLKGAPDERIFPVGRLDRNTTGVLLLTNDGELTQKLTHPSFEVKKVYEVRLDKPLQKKDMETILHGISLEDGFIAADAISYADMKDKSVIGIEIHSGRNRIVRRLFEYLGYDVKNLDRVLFANLTKKNVERGKWRFLKEKEIRILKYMNQSFVKRSRVN